MRRVEGAGQLRNYVEVQKRTEPADTGGHPVPAWKTFSKCHAAIHPVSGDEKMRGNQIEAGVTTIVTTYYREDVTPGMRFVKGKRVLNIVRAYDRDDDRKWLESQCKEVASA